MVGRVAVLLDELNHPPRIARGRRDHPPEGNTPEMLRARAGEEPAAGHQPAERLEVHVLVAAQTRREVATPAHEGRRIEHDHVERITRRAQVLEYVALDPRNGAGREPVLDPRRLAELER